VKAFLVAIFSATLALSLAAPNQVTLHVEITSPSTSIYLGQQAFFKAVANATMNSFHYKPIVSFYYQWYLNGNPITGETSTSYRFTPQTLGTFNIYVTVQDIRNPQSGIIKSNTITLSVTPISTPTPTQESTPTPTSTSNPTSTPTPTLTASPTPSPSTSPSPTQQPTIELPNQHNRHCLQMAQTLLT
jgi:hypothetical protein